MKKKDNDYKTNNIQRNNTCTLLLLFEKQGIFGRFRYKFRLNSKHYIPNNRKELLYIKRNKRYLIQSRKCKYKLNVKHSLDAEKAKSAIFLLLKCKCFALIVIYLNFEIYLSFLLKILSCRNIFRKYESQNALLFLLKSFPLFNTNHNRFINVPGIFKRVLLR